MNIKSCYKKSRLNMILIISLTTIILSGLYFSTNYANAQESMSRSTPISGQYTNPDYGVSITLPNGWIGGEQKAPQGTMVTMRPSEKPGPPLIFMTMVMAPKESIPIKSIDSLYPGPFAMVADGSKCDNPIVTTKSVNGVNLSEFVEVCGAGTASAKMKEDVIQTDKYYMIISYMAFPSSAFDSNVATYDTSIGTLQVTNAIDAPTIPGTNQQPNTSTIPSQPTSVTPSSQSSNTVSIPSWVKKNAKWWSQNQVGDNDFVNGMQYLLSQGILRIPPTTVSASSSQQIPAWIKNTAGWWSSGQIPDDQFVKSIQYLISQGIITISSSSSSGEQTSQSQSSTLQSSNQQSYSNVQPPSNTPQTQTVTGSLATSTSNTGTDSVVATVGVGTNPLGVAFDPVNGYVYVDNENDNSVSVIDGNTNTLATGFTNPIAVGHAPYGIAINGSVYVSNLGSSTVSVIDGSTNTLATGFTNPISVGSFPNGVVSLPNGYFYVVNNHDNSVSVIDTHPSHTSFNTVIATIPVGTVGTGPNVAAFDPANGYMYVTSNDGVYVIDTSTNALATGFTNPIQTGATTGVAVDTANNYVYATNYAADTVTIINGATNILATGFTNPISVGTNPYGVTYDQSDQSIYVANQGSNTVTKISSTTTPTVAQTIQVGNQPWGEAYDTKNNCVYVGNYADGTVSVICPSGTSQGTGTTSSSAGSSTGTTGTGQTYNLVTSWGDNVGLNGGGYNPNLAGVAVDSSGNVYVTESFEGLVLKFDNNGKFITSWTHEQYTNGGNCPGQLADPYGIGIDSSNNVYVLDASNLMIKKFDSNGNFIKEWGNTYTSNCIPGSGGSGNGQFAPSPQAGLAIDQSGNVYAIDSANDRIEKFDSNGNFITTWKITDPVDSYVDLSNPIGDGIAVDQSGNVYLNIHGQSAVVKYSQTTSSCPAGTQLGSYNQNSVTTNICFVKSWEKNTNQFPTGDIAGIAIDSSGNLYLNAGEGGIQKFDSNGNFITSFSLESGINGQGLPSGVAIDSSGNVFVIDYSNFKVQKFGPATP